MCENEGNAPPILQDLPNIDQLNSLNFDQFIEITSSVQIDGTELESFLETHINEMDEYVTNIESFSAVKLRESLTASVLKSIPFPYTTTKLRTKQSELINWLKRHKSLQTNNIDLLRQRVTNYFKIKVQEIPFLKQENISYLVERKIGQIKNSFTYAHE